MTVEPLETERALEVVAAARGGDEDAFRALTEPHRRALQVHCYRMTGSLHDAEDVVQETMLRAWRRLETYAARSSFRAWLYGIATNACLDLLASRARRALPQEVAPPDDPRAVPAPSLEVPWLQPFPDRLLDPAEALDRRETVRLAFVAALQHLSARERAVLILREVLEWPARDVANLLGSSVASVNSALRRARARMPHVDEPGAVDESVVARYVEAWHARDVAALAALLKDDVELAMPPTPSWYSGRDAVTTFLAATFERFAELGVVATRANGCPALAVYVDGAPLAINVLEGSRQGIERITGFADPALFPHFRVPSSS